MTSRQVSVDSWNSISPGRREPRDPEVARLARPVVHGIRRELGEWVTRARAEAGLDRREVAERMGYGRVDRGMARLARWERGEDAVWGDRIPVLAAALGASVSAKALGRFGRRELEALEDAAQQVNRRRAEDRRALDAEWQLLARHAVELLRRLRSDEDLTRVPDVVLRSTGWSIMLMGGGYFSLRMLLGAWRSGRLTLKCDCCGGPLLLTWVSGSPLSGAHRLAGLCESTGRYRTVGMPPGESLMGLVRPALEDRREVADPSGAGEHVGGAGEGLRHDLTLAEALGTLGFDVAQVRIRDADRATMALFDPGSGVLTPLNGMTRAVADGAAVSELAMQVVAQRSARRSGGVPVIGSIAPLTFGCWMGEVVELTDPDGRVWRMHPGHLEDPDQRAVAWFDAPVSVAVAGWVTANL